MCRIAGLVDHRISAEERSSRVAGMLLTMQAGGPDGAGMFSCNDHPVVLGHRRLAILDLSDAGHQPMANPDATLHLTYNGEIYNFRSLRLELQALGYTFHSGTDTEVILQAYVAWGEDSFSRLSGMFAFVLYDQRRQLLWLVRDQLGIKPLYWAELPGNGLAFASSVQALSQLAELTETQPNWPIYFLAFGHLPEPITTRKCIQPAKPGFAKRYCLQSRTTTNYAIQPKPIASPPMLVERTEVLRAIQSTVQASVDQQLISDAPLGVFLSGGVDSSILAVCAAKSKPDLVTSAVYFNEKNYSEWQFQQAIKAKLQSATHHNHAIHATDFFGSFDQLFADLDQPSCDGINTWFIAKHARAAGLKAVLSGIGGDEYWGGYPSFKRMPLALLLQQSPRLGQTWLAHLGPRRWRRLVYLRLEGLCGLYLSLRGLFTPEAIAQKLGCSESEVWTALEELAAEHRQPLPKDPFELTTLLESTWYMRNQLLRDCDAMSMAHGLEIRVPLLDDQMIALSRSVSPELKKAGPLPKWLLIEAFRDELPNEIWNRPKMGFTFPFDTWFRTDAAAESFFADVPQQAYQDFIKGNMHWSQLYSLHVLNRMGFA